jgi:ribose-phosphate pyrophosphokinase
LKTLNLINPAGSDIAYRLFTFPDGQPHIIIEPPKRFEYEVKIISRLANPSDLLLILCAADVLTRLGSKKIHLELSYLLGARMDRVMSLGEPFTLEVIIRQLEGFESITVFDPHSNVGQLISWTTLTAVTNQKFFTQVIKSIHSIFPEDDIILISPDEGASEKTAFLSFALGIPAVQCYKERDTATGRLSNPTIHPEANIVGKSCLVVDDICDGGYTFVQLAQLLKEKGAADMFLAVSHGIFSKGLEPLADYTHVFTTNSYKQHESTDRLTVFELW